MLELEKIKTKALGSAVKTLNDSGLIEKPIKIVGQPKENLVSAFVATVKSIPGGAGGKKCPKAVKDFYNQIMAPDEKPIKADKPVKAEKPQDGIKKVGIIATIIESLQKKPHTKDELHQILVKKFPDRPAAGMKSTVSIQLGPTRLGSKFKLIKDGDKYHIEA